MFKKIRVWIKQLLCIHDYAWYVKPEGMFTNISGETRIRVCKKCGKVNGEYFAEYEGMGFK